MDHCVREKRKRNPRETTNIFGLLTFTYIAGIVKKAFKRDLKDDDLYEVIHALNSQRCGGKLEKCWSDEKERKKSKGKPLSVPKIFWKRWGKRYIIFGMVDFLWHTCKSIIKPWALSNLLAYFTPGQTAISKNESYFYGFVFLLEAILFVFFMHNYNLWGQTFGTELKTAFSSLLYRKAIRLTPAALSDISLGNIVTLITKDVQTFRMSIWVFNDIWIACSQIIVVCTLLYIKVGPVSLLGVAILVISIPIQVVLGKCVAKLRLKTSAQTDKRLQVTQEILSTMRIIKIYTWEAFFENKIHQARKKEIAKLLLGFYLRIVMWIVGALSSKLGFYVLIISCIWAGVTTDTTVILYVMSNFKDLRHWLGGALPYSMGQTGEFFSAYKRIVAALEAEELEPNREDDKPTDKPLVEVINATVAIKDATILNDLSFKTTSGLTLMTGTVGSGKSSVFKTILQDYPLKSGEVNTRGRIAYASQDPWLFPSSIKQNILFGQEYDEKRYQEVIRVCALLFDFNLLEHGDETIVTDRGLNLSKGQQARINLARAIYRDSEIYLLDDCLTALDANVQDYIFNECIKKFLKNKIVILISQTASHIHEADNVIIMDKGRIKDIGPPSEGIYNEVKELAVEDDDLDKEVVEPDNQENESNEKSGLIETEQIIGRKKVYSEVQKQGSVDYEVYKKYLIFGGGVIMVILNLFGGGLTQYTFSYSEKLLTVWIDKKQTVLNIVNNVSIGSAINKSALEEALDKESNTFRIYTIMVILSTGLELISSYLFIEFCRRSSVNIHKAITNKISHAVMSFFDTHLIGNILNRFSQDLVNIDEMLPFTLNECYGVLLGVLGQLVLIISVKLEFSIYIIGMIATVVFIRWLYLPAGRSLKRLEAATRSPMIGHVNATLEGLTTIRACNVEQLLIDEFDRHQNLHMSAYFISMSTARGIGFLIDSVCSSFLVVVVLKFLFFSENATTGEVTLALTQGFAFCRTIQWGVRSWAELENLMTSVERLLEYTDIKTEQKDGLVLENWPSKGAITYEKVSLSYNNSEDFVLKDLNFEILPKETVGVVGRTGAGKSSIISTIFRLYEAHGTILIDGVDIKTLSLDFLRKSIAIIPQDPIIFSGTIRTNLDPLNEFKDEELWESLEKVGMKNQISSLYQIVNSTNLNYSLGQKQLICLSRAILHKNKIVIMDEATANMDHETDAALHKIIKENFVDATVFTIAHRLHSILECDKVIVLDRGEIKEFNDPATLLDNENGLFYKMVKQAGLLNYLR